MAFLADTVVSTSLPCDSSLGQIAENKASAELCREEKATAQQLASYYPNVWKGGRL